MTGAQRREQLLAIGRGLFAEKGFEGTSVEEIAATAGVSKPVVYEHFGGKDGLYAVVVEVETHKLLEAMKAALTKPNHPRRVLEIAAMTLLDYIEAETDGFRILVRDSPITEPRGGFSSLLSDVAGHVEYILAEQFADRGFDSETAPLYAQMLVGMVAFTGQFWLDHRRLDKAVVASHIVNLAWNGLTGLEASPALRNEGALRAAAGAATEAGLRSQGPRFGRTAPEDE